MLRRSLVPATMVILWSMGFPALIRANEAVDVLPAQGFAKARQPQVAVSPSGTVYLTFGVENAIYCVASTDGARTWKEPVKVGEVGALALGKRRGPRVVATDKAIVVTAIGGKEGKGRDEDLLAWRSENGGATWKGPVTVNSVQSSVREGLHHTVAAPDGTLYTVWLDLRARKMQVFGASSKDGGTTWADERLIYESPDGGVCPCCQPQAHYDAKGALHIMWRNNLAGARDMFTMQSEDHGKTFSRAIKLGNGTWPLNACPMDGGGLAGTDAGLVTIWRREKEVFRCEPGQAEKLLGRGEQPWAAAGPGGVYLVWIVARGGEVMALEPGSDRPVSLAEKGYDPVVAASVGGKGPVIVAWEEGEPNAKRLRVTTLMRGRAKSGL